MGVLFGADRLFLRAGDGSWLTAPLPENLTRVSPSEPNLSSPAEAARALDAALTRLASGGRGNGAGGRPPAGPFRESRFREARFREAVVAIPDRAVAVGLADSSGPRRRRRLRASLAATLSAGAVAGAAPSARMRFGSLRSGSLRRSSLLGAAVAGPVAAQYESVVEAAGLAVRWVDTPTLALLPEWLAAGPGSGARSLLALHRRHFALAAASGRRLTAFRLKLRAALDPEPPALAARRLAAGAASGERPTISVCGEGAEETAALLREADLPPVSVRAAAGSDSFGASSGTSFGPASTGAALSPVWADALGALLRRLGGRPAPLAAEPVAAEPG